MFGKKIEKNNVTNALNVLYTMEELLLMFCILKKEKISPAYVSKHNSNHEKQILLLMILNRQGWWHYLAVKKLCIIKRNHYTSWRLLLSELL